MTSGQFTFLPNKTYDFSIWGTSRVNTRLLLEDQLLRTNIATVTGTPVGLGGTVQDTDNATVAVNTTTPQPAPALGSAVASNSFAASNSNELFAAMMPGTEALMPEGSGLI